MANIGDYVQAKEKLLITMVDTINGRGSIDEYGKQQEQVQTLENELLAAGFPSDVLKQAVYEYLAAAG